MFTEALLTILPKEPKSLPKGEWIKKSWPIQITKYCTTVKVKTKTKNKIKAY